MNSKIDYYKISQNLYNGKYGVGSIFENSMLISISQIKEEKHIYAVARRAFINSKLSRCAVEFIPNNFSVDLFLDAFNKLSESDGLKPTNDNKIGFSPREYISEFSITHNNDKYSVPLKDELGIELLKAIDFNQLVHLSNKDVCSKLDPESKRILIYKRDDDSLLAVIKAINNHLDFRFIQQNDELKAYFESNREQWESQVFILRVIEETAHGVTESKKGVGIGDSMYLNGLYLYLFDNARKQIFDMRYIFQTN